VIVQSNDFEINTNSKNFDCSGFCENWHISGNTFSNSVSTSSTIGNIRKSLISGNALVNWTVTCGSGNFELSIGDNNLDGAFFTGCSVWTAATLINSWINGGGSFPTVVGYRRDSVGRVSFQGTIKSGAIGSVPFVIADSTYCPRDGPRFFATAADSTAFAVIQVNPNCNVIVWLQNNNVALDVVSFVP
jgi:hypothetical protein